MSNWPLVPSIQNGPASAGVFNAPLDALRERTEMLKETVSALTAGSGVVLRDMPCSSDVTAGDAVYFDSVSSLFKKAKRLWRETPGLDGVLELDDQAYASGIVVSKTGAGRCSVQTEGLVSSGDITAAVFTDGAGFYELSSETAGLLVKTDTQSRGALACCLDSSSFLVLPIKDKNPGHQHKEFTLDNSKWLPADSALFDGMTKPDGAVYGYDVTDPAMSELFLWPLSCVRLVIDGRMSVTGSRCVVNSDNIWKLTENPALVTDTFIERLLCLYRFDATQPDGAFKDQSPYNLPVFIRGEPVLDSEFSRSFNASLFMDGPGQGLEIRRTGVFEGLSDFSINLSLYYSDESNTTRVNPLLCCHRDADTDSAEDVGWKLDLLPDRTLRFTLNDSSVVSAAALTVNTWHDITVMRSDGVVTIVIDGESDANSLEAADLLSVIKAHGLLVGHRSEVGDEFGAGLRLSNLRISSVARTQSDWPYESDSHTLLYLPFKATESNAGAFDVSASPVTLARSGASVYVTEDSSGSGSGVSMAAHFDNNMEDSSVYGRDLTAHDCAFSENSKFGSHSLFLDGQSKYASFSLPPFSSTKDFTVHFWLRPGSSGCSAAENSFLVGNRDFDTSYGWAVMMTRSETIWFGIEGSSFTANCAAITDFTKFHHIAVVRYNGRVKVAVDGVFSSNYIDFSAESRTPSNPLFTVGQSLGRAAYYCEGHKLDELIIVHDTALWRHSDFTPPASPYNPTRSATPGKALLLDADGSAVTGRSSKLNLADSDFTVEFMFSVMTLKSQPIASGLDMSWKIDMVLDTGVVRLQTALSSDGALWDIMSEYSTKTDWEASKLYHAALVRSGTDVRLYIDGSAVVSKYIGSASVADSGGVTAGGTDHGGGFISMLRLRKEAVYTADFTPPQTYPQPDSDTVFQLSVNSEQKPVCLDATANSLNASFNGNAYPWCPQGETDVKACVESGGWIETPEDTRFDFGSDNFTAAGYFMLDAFGSGQQTLMGGRQKSWRLYFDPSDSRKLCLSLSSHYSYGWNILNGGRASRTDWSAGVVYHIALVRKDGVARVYINGVDSYYFAVGSASLGPAGSVYIGSDLDGHALGGVANNVLIANSALWSSDFTPPSLDDGGWTEPYPASEVRAMTTTPFVGGEPVVRSVVSSTPAWLTVSAANGRVALLFNNPPDGALKSSATALRGFKDGELLLTPVVSSILAGPGISLTQRAEGAVVVAASNSENRRIEASAWNLNNAVYSAGEVMFYLVFPAGREASVVGTCQLPSFASDAGMRLVPWCQVKGAAGSSASSPVDTPALTMRMAQLSSVKNSAVKAPVVWETLDTFDAVSMLESECVLRDGDSGNSVAALPGASVYVKLAVSSPPVDCVVFRFGVKLFPAE